MKHEPLEIQGFQRRYLRGLAHNKNPVVQVGQSGITTAVTDAVDQALSDHELIKVRLYRPDDKKSMAAELAEKTQSAVCGLVGHTVILYRPDKEEPKIKLPQK
jgi:RNA-binding protein